ncbi:PREDICTED: uncharacterized protein LOC109591675 [Amphimedon queenslandica]|uniref:Uncharacterized protein n=2 Tax=Amphimedon queenslandica TaxID=400682 RepID=A0AAN0K0N7_AMPQE|nr:PREDICTED: uncharacterized protein LOC109591675 [Amphimedon queenslandica]|eukprot:XP_019862916.1 PREDICTED: uncharacterized protein LOC109591675 [Amphimedon queenslandica]
MFTSVASPSPLTCTLSGCERCDTTSSNCCQVCSSGYSFISDNCVCGIQSTAGIPVWSIVIISVLLVIVIVTVLLLIMCTIALVKVKHKNTQSDQPNQPFYDYIDVQQRTGPTVPDPVKGHNSLSLNHSVDMQTDHNPCYAVAMEETQLVPNPSYASTTIQQ